MWAACAGERCTCDSSRSILILSPGSMADLAETRPDCAADPIVRQRGTRIGDYVVLEELGRGAMGQVFRALHPQLDRRVALKLIALPVIDEARRAAGVRVL